MEILLFDDFDSAENLALEETLAQCYPGNLAIIWRNAESIIVGRNQDTLSEIDLDFILDNGIGVFRRNSGGGAIYQSTQVVNMSVIGQRSNNLLTDFEDLTQPVRELLASLGINTKFSGKNDLTVDSKKIAGSAKYILKDRQVFHMTMLFNADIDRMNQALTRRGKSYKPPSGSEKAVVNIATLLQSPMTVESFVEKLADQIKKSWLANSGIIPDVIYEQAALLASNKYRVWQWNFGGMIKNPDRVLKRVFKYGLVELRLKTAQNRIVQAKFTGDFFVLKNITELENMLLDCPCSPSELEAVMMRANFSDYIASFSPEDLKLLLYGD